jgi:predicted DNA binding CopG/RHH family protein
MKMARKKSTNIEDKDDLAMIAAYERGEFRPVRNQKAALQMAQQAAMNTRMKKEARVNIRLQASDLDGLRLRAEEEGIPYQTLIASVLHKYVSGRLVPKDGRK